MGDKDNSPEIRFDGRVAVVTGAGRGLGRIYACELARRGAKVVVNDLGGASDGTGDSTSPADAVVAEIAAAGGEAVASYDSVAIPEGAEGIVRTAVQRFGKVDILISNAGILRDKSFARMSIEEWEAVLKVHLDGTFHVARAAYGAMREQGYGRIVMATSSQGLFGSFGQANYAAAKMGIVGLMLAVKQEGAKYNIKLNCIAPSAATRLTMPIMSPDNVPKMDPRYVAPIVLYLCSEACPENGMIYWAGTGLYARVAVVVGPGVFFAGGDVPTPEDIAANWPRISTLEGASDYPDANSAFAGLMRAERIQPRGCAEPKR